MAARKRQKSSCAGRRCPSWERKLDEGSDCDSEGEEAHAGKMLYDLVVTLYLSGFLSAKRTCVLSHWASKAGARGAIGELALAPTAQTGHYQRKLNVALGFNTVEDHYFAELIGFDDAMASRSKRRVDVLPPHEVLHRELSERDMWKEELQESIRSQEWAADYHNHATVLANPGKNVIPIVLYVDGLRTTKKDGVIGFYVYTALTLRRHLVACVRRSTLCRCSCRGWCTLHEVFRWLHWSFSACATGLFPLARHDGLPWLDSDDSRSAFAGHPLCFQGALLQIRGDWCEYATTFGLHPWSSVLHPCFLCDTGAEIMCSKIKDCSVDGVWPWTDRSDDDYQAACARCEIKVQVNNQAELRTITRQLEFSERHRGRACTRRLPAFGLEPGDRVEPCGALPDHALLEEVELPATILFWRQSRETGVRRRHPLLVPDLGVGLHTFCIDSMHTLSLGVFQLYIHTVFWRAIRNNAWSFGGDKPKKELERLGCMALKASLFEWYGAQKRIRPDISRVQDLTLKMLGSDPEARTLKLKAMETKDMVPFATELARRFPELPGSGLLLRAGQALQRFNWISDHCGRRLQASDVQELMATLVEHVACMEHLDVELLPKHHLWTHMVRRSLVQGNFTYYATWVDEDINGVVAIICRSCHAQTFERRVLQKFKELQRMRQ
jgi:hypothetical protein